MTPRFKGKPAFDLSQACPQCHYKILPQELVRLASHLIECPKCKRTFENMPGKKAIGTSS